MLLGYLPKVTATIAGGHTGLTLEQTMLAGE
jgi:hypothetical protein